jgi:hypothetical protein
MLSFLSHMIVAKNLKLKMQKPLYPAEALNRFLAARCSFWFTLITLFILSLVFSTLTVQAASVTLAWDPNPSEQNVAGYKIYLGTESQNYTTVINVTNGTQKAVMKLKKGMLYFFALSAYDADGRESDLSQEVMANTCTHKISPRKKTFKATGGIGKIKVVTQPICEWTATSGAEWLQIMDGHSGRGPGEITYSVEPNSTPEKRVVSSAFGGKTFTVTQKGSTLP